MQVQITILLNDSLLKEVDKHNRGNRSHAVREILKAGIKAIRNEGAK